MDLLYLYIYIPKGHSLGGQNRLLAPTSRVTRPSLLMASSKGVPTVEELSELMKEPSRSEAEAGPTKE
jgi:hypothetical protein